VKSPLRFSKASGSERQRIPDMIRGQRRFSPRAWARRAARRQKGHDANQ
jgi:hypothetical protein